MEIEIWKYTDTESKVYTDSATLLKIIFKLIKNDRVAATYFYKGKVIAWDVVVPTRNVNRINTEFKQITKTTKARQAAIKKAKAKPVKVVKSVKPKVATPAKPKAKAKKVVGKPTKQKDIVSEFFTIDEQPKTKAKSKPKARKK